MARAEIAALLPQMETNPLSGRRLLELKGDASIKHLAEAVAISSGCQAILCNAVIWSWEQHQSLEALVTSVSEHIALHEREGSVAVRAWRHEGRIEDLGTRQSAQKLGGRFHDIGCAFDLEEPEIGRAHG